MSSNPDGSVTCTVMESARLKKALATPIAPSRRNKMSAALENLECRCKAAATPPATGRAGPSKRSGDK
ncbi:hypothetical protein JR065_14245 [Xanthomonas sp. AmX2]|uniref:hypothetical protein n=1 Tax=Xanthomonas sp. TaxID=29446 RepID=UPI0019809A07|nr:hypothetical protein [Xanthomonas sp.]MBN6151503.1 hypothetical protein [Xanthomonas sp.]